MWFANTGSSMSSNTAAIEINQPQDKPAPRTIDVVRNGMAKRRRAEQRFRLYGLAAIVASLLFLSFLFISIIGNGYSAFWQTYVELKVNLDPDQLPREELARADYSGLIKQSLRDAFPEVSGRREKRQLYGMISSGAAFKLRDLVMADPTLIGQNISLWVPADDDVDMYFKGHSDRNAPEDQRRLNDVQLQWLDQLEADGRVRKQFNRILLTAGDSREPELAGIWGAVRGSFFTLLVTLLLSFPIGVMSAVYLEEFAPKNRWTDLIEVNINNLAAVPSIVFGLLGLAVFINFFGLPRSAPLVLSLIHI